MTGSLGDACRSGGGILNRAGRCNWTLTFILALTGRGDREPALPGRWKAEADLRFYSDREQSSALRATLRLIPGAGVTPAQGGTEPTGGSACNQVLSVELFADAEVFEDCVEDVFVADFAGD